MKSEIIRLLKECDGYLSGQELCERLHVSRTAVWKVIKQLQEEGYQIEAVRNKGYHLVEGADVLTKAELMSCITGTRMGCRIEFFEKTDSTNTQVKRLAEAGAPEGTLAVAECQMSGKGRRGRTWVSPSGTGIWMSLLLRPRLAPTYASMITLVAAMAISAGIEDVCSLKSQIKWPNDLVVSGKKLCGILTEMSTEVDMIQYVIVGIGINVNTTQFPDEISGTATSVYLESGKTWKRSDIISCIMRRFEEYYEKFLQTSDMTLLQEEYQEKLVNRNREVTVLAPGAEYRGICRGIDKDGELLVEREDQTISRVISGEVSVRGVYGYV